MPPNKAVPGSPEEWLARAKADLVLARSDLLPGGVYEDLCYHAQQAAEKAIKAVFVRHGWDFPYIHDLDQLIGGLERRQLAVPTDIATNSPRLSIYAYDTRYPTAGEPVTAEDHRQAVEIATRVVRWAEGQITGGE